MLIIMTRQYWKINIKKKLKFYAPNGTQKFAFERLYCTTNFNERRQSQANIIVMHADKRTIYQFLLSVSLFDRTNSTE